MHFFSAKSASITKVLVASSPPVYFFTISLIVDFVQENSWILKDSSLFLCSFHYDIFFYFQHNQSIQWFQSQCIDGYFYVLRLWIRNMEYECLLSYNRFSFDSHEFRYHECSYSWDNQIPHCSMVWNIWKR